MRDKVAEIQLPSETDQTGDTPTMYAGIKNMTKHEEDADDDGEKADEKEEGLSIFGIPIPKIPLPILSFGLTPAISHGLLPIGRYGRYKQIIGFNRILICFVFSADDLYN